MSQFGAIPTRYYLQREAARAAGGAQIQFATFAVGDGNGQVPALSDAGGGLIHEVYRAAVSSVQVNQSNAQQIDILCLIPDAAGSFTIRELAIFDETGGQVVAAITSIVKLSSADGQTSDLSFYATIAISNQAAVATYAPSGGFATQAWVQSQIAAISIPAYTATEGVKITGRQASLDVVRLIGAAQADDSDLLPVYKAAPAAHQSLTLAALVTYLRNKLNFIVATKDALLSVLGFTPVQQGGGVNQLNNKVMLGWDGTGLRAQVDATDLGRLSFGTPAVPAQPGWVNAHVTFTVVNGVLQVLSQFNVASVTRISAGNYIVNFASPMPSANYSAAWMTTNDGASNDSMVHYAATFGASGYQAQLKTQLQCALYVHIVKVGQYDPALTSLIFVGG